jgi:hypothetical protein
MTDIVWGFRTVENWRGREAEQASLANVLF